MSLHRITRLFVPTCLVLTLAVSLGAQTPATPPAFKGVWEPVSFGEDLDLREVFFVTITKGWAAGEKGTILRTIDGGATWTAQMGGDPAADEDPVTLLRFVDEQHGWAVKDGRVLRTEDGENWEDLGAVPFSIGDLAMSSAREGVASGHVGMGWVPSTLFHTTDGGKTWKETGACRVKAMVDGLNRELSCDVVRFQFVSATVGYLAARTHCVGSGCDGPPILARTDDGGASWRFFTLPADNGDIGVRDLFFTDEQTGIVRTSDGKLSRTTDGGATWKGLLASVGSSGMLGFADPEVGWAIEDYKMSFTTDGGTRWNSRPYRFPATPRAWSFPRRDRAYVVGDHGMVFRYSVVPVAQPVPASTIAAPVMPSFGSPLESQVPELTGFVQDLTAAVDKLPDSASGTPAASTSAPSGGFEQDTGPPSAFVAQCCGTRVNKLNALLGAVLQSLPSFVSRFKNTNLLVAGLRMLSTMPSQLSDVKNAFRDFKSATDKSAAQAALVRLGSAAGSLKQSTRAAFQKEATP